MTARSRANSEDAAAEARAVRVVVHLARSLEKVCEDTGLTINQYRVLTFVEAEPQRAGELATRVAVSRPTLTFTLDSLEARKLVRRERVPGDRRGISLELTHDGRKAVQAVDEALVRFLADLVPPAELGALARSLGLVGDGLFRAWQATHDAR